MAIMEILSFILSLVVIKSLRCLFPRSFVPLVSTSFEEVVTLLEHAEVINVANVSEYRAKLAMYACLFPLAVSPSTDLTQSAPSILTDAYGEPSLSGIFSTILPALSLWSNLETVCPQIGSRHCSAKYRGRVKISLT
jgi:hypothetical protein